MKKIISLLIISLVIIIPLKVKALSVDKNNLTIEKNNSETIGLYTEVNSEITELQFTLVYTTYDVPANFNIEAGLTDTNPNGIVHKIIFSSPVSGKIKLGNIKINVVNNPKVTAGTINIHSGKAITTNGETINLDSQTINVKIGTPENDNVNQKKEEPVKKTNLLDRIESKIVKINLKDNVYEYKVNIKEDIEELDLKPVPKDEDYKVEITTQKIKELTDNQIIITVKDGDNTEKYKIKVNIIKNNKDIDIDKEEFIPTFKYKGKWITIIVILSISLFIGLLLIKKK